VLLRRAQHSQSLNPLFALDIARTCVAGKVRNSRQVLLRGARDAKVDSDVAALTRGAQDLAATLRALPDAKDLDVLRGLEGEAARQYFDRSQCWSRRTCEPSFPWAGGHAGHRATG
jgi:CRISPR-associated protein Cas1